MVNFYDNWLGLWDKATEEKASARKVIHAEEVEWVSTPQDARVGLLASPETGFRTWGTVTMLAEIPVGWNTGKHIHGEEGVHIVEGEGFSVINGVRYDWDEGATLWVPFGAEHQHFNTGPEPALYYSVMAVHLEHFVGLHKMEQLEECGYTEYFPEVEASTDGLDPVGRRISLRWDDAPRRDGGEDASKKNEAAHFTGDTNEATKAAHHAFMLGFMGSPRAGQGFHNKEIEISGVLGDSPHSHGGRHAHMEAILYVLQGEGYTIMDGEKVEWKKGSCFHVQGPQTMHQHFVTSDVPSHLLRTAPGIRAHFFQEVAKERFPYLVFEGAGPTPRA